MMPRDLRGLAPPGPLEIILAEVDEAKPGKQLAYVLPHFLQSGQGHHAEIFQTALPGRILLPGF